MNRNDYQRSRDNEYQRNGIRDEQQRPRSRDEWTRRHAMHRDVQEPVRPWSPGGEYLRDVPVHREGRPDVEYEYAHSGDYSDNVVGGDYLRSYGDIHGDQPGPDLYSQDRSARPEDYSRDDMRSGARRQQERHRSLYGSRGAERDIGSGSRFGTGAYGAMYGERYRYADEGRFGGHRGKAPKGYLRSDDRIREDINERLTDDDSIDPTEISVEVKGGIVTLTGSVEQRWMKHRAEDIAEACSGVKDVVNQIRVSSAKNAP